MPVVNMQKHFLNKYKKQYGEEQFNFLKAVCKGEIDLSDILEIEEDNTIIGKLKRIIYKIVSKYINLVETVKNKIRRVFN